MPVPLEHTLIVIPWQQPAAPVSLPDLLLRLASVCYINLGSVIGSRYELFNYRLNVQIGCASHLRHCVSNIEQAAAEAIHYALPLRESLQNQQAVAALSCRAKAALVQLYVLS